MKTILKRLSIFGLLLSLASVFVLGQAISGDLVGTVRDGSGAVLANITVEATNIGTGFKQSVQTTSGGEYHFVNLPVGHYKVTAVATGLSGGFADLEVQLNKTTTGNITAQVASAGTTLEVTAQTETIDTTTAQIQNTYEQKQMQDLPSASIGLGVLNLSLLDAGVASSGGIGVGTGPSVSGQRPRNNNFTVEGIDNNSKSVTGPVVTIPNDAVQNFTVLQNQFSPEFGHSSGGQFNQTLISGTNKFHGRAYEYFQNRDLNAIDASVARTQTTGKPFNPRFDNNRFGGQIGGPIFKDKLFFFTNNEYNPIGNVTGASFGCAPTAAGYAQIEALAGSDPNFNAGNYGIYKQYVGAAPSVAGPNDPCFSTTSFQGVDTIPAGVVNTNGAYFTNNFTSSNSIDYNISEKDQLRGRWIYARTTTLDFAANIPAFWTPLPVRNHLITLSEYHTFTPSLTNELRLGYNRNTQYFTVGPQTFPGTDQFPNIFIDEFNTQLGPDGNAPQFGVQNIYQATNNLSWVKGRHNFKFGVEGRKYISPQGFTQRARGDYEYSTFQGFVDDIVPDVFGERSTGSNTYYGDQSAIYAYANDQMKVNQHLTLNLGVRYEFTSVPFSERLQNLNSGASVPGLISFNAPQPQYKNFAPRVGFAYSPGSSGSTSIRGGFGMSYDVLFDNLGLLSVPPQFGGTCDVSNGSTGACTYPTTGGFLAGGGLPPGNGSGLQSFPDAVSAQSFTAGFVPEQQLPYTETWNFGIQHVFASKYTIDVRYVGTRGIHLPVQDQINKHTLVTASNSLPTYLTAPSQATLDALPVTLAGLVGPTNVDGARVNRFVPAFIAGCNDATTFVSPCFESTMTSYQPYGKSLYHGLQTQLSRNFTNGLQFQVAWTWSHAWDNSTAEVFSTQLTPRRPQDSQNVAADYGTSALDRRHRVTVEVLYDLPFFKNGNWIAKNVLGNWELAPVYTFQSPEYWTAQSGADANLNGDAAPDRTIVNPSGIPGTGSTVSALTNTAGDTVAYLADTPGAQYIMAGPGAFATGARNTVALPHINNFDFTVVKRIAFTEHQSLEFQAQALNVFNHSQYIAGAISRVDPFGFTSITDFVSVQGANFNQPQKTFSNQARSMQLALKYIF
jgi:hypothetical protein